MSSDAPADTRPSYKVVDCFERYAEARTRLQGGVYHLPGWKAAFDSYGLQTHWLVAERDGVGTGILPLVRQSSRLFGRRLASLPWVDEAGAVGDQAAVHALMQHATRIASQLGQGYSVVIKQAVNAPPVEDVAEWSLAAGDKVLMRLALAPTADDLWKRLSAKVRNQVRKAEKSGVTTRRGGSELLADFFEVYSHNMRDLGSPSHSLGFFQALLDSLGERASLYGAYLDGKAVGAAIVLDNRPSCDIPWASSLREHNSLCVNHGMYWQILSDACNAEYSWFHFGRSSAGSGQHKFKQQWGAEEVSLAWFRFAAGRAVHSPDNRAALQEKFGLAEKLWTKLPLWLARKLGPRLIRHAP